jgi:hypothetical protein
MTHDGPRNETDGGAGGGTPRAGKVGPRSNPRSYFFDRDGEMTAIKPIDDETARTVLGERADRRRFGEAGHYFRCKACSGWIDARDRMDRGSRRPAAAPGARSGAVEVPRSGAGADLCAITR